MNSERADIQGYKNVFPELSIADELILRGSRIVVPTKLRQKVIEIAHEGHQGQVRTKQLLRAHVWFPAMDSQCEKFVSTCIACQANTPRTHRAPLKMTELRDGPWRKVSVDFCGPMASGDLALVFYCQYSRYPLVEFVGSTGEKATIPVFKRVLNTFGVPTEIKSDNGPPFNGHAFQEYAEEEGFHHRRVTPGWPEANGDVERFMQRIKNSARIASMEGRPVGDEIRRGVRAYRATAHPTTGKARTNSCLGANCTGNSQRQGGSPTTRKTRLCAAATKRGKPG